ncbi:MAG: glycosyltransferase [Actinobacteria bacterium]|nr:glycosyltransferase [Actinomycetota bacterium]
MSRPLFRSPTAKRSGECRVDLHLHSRFSRESDLWVLRQAGIGESNTDPEAAYKAAKARGMTYVTLTDHNTIDGGLTLIHHDDFFLSEEVTTYFPDEDVKLHVLALGITGEQHREIQAVRRNLYELVTYLKGEDILYVLAHPLTRLGGELTPGHLERLMLLFPIWEVHNGSTLESENNLSQKLAELSSPEKLAELAELHDLEPMHGGIITYTAGSDDHAGFDIANARTITADTGSIDGFLAEVKAGRSTIEGSHGSTLKLAHTMLGLLAHNTDDEEDTGPSLLGKARTGRKWVRLLSIAVGGDSTAGALKKVMADRDLRKAFMPLMTSGHAGGDEFHNQIYSLVNAAWTTGMRTTIADLSELTLSNFVVNLDRIGRLVALQILLLPHSLASNYHSRQRHFLRRLSSQMLPDTPTAEPPWPRVALFTDTLDQVNGVTSIIGRIGEYCRDEDLPLEIIACGGNDSSRKKTSEGSGNASNGCHEGQPAGSRDGQPAGGRVTRFPAVASVNLPDFGNLDMSVPPVLDIIRYCEEQQFDVIHSATPGPMGLVAFMVSRILQVPFVSSYHTDIPRCVGRLTDDKLNEEAAWTYTRWYYQRCDLTFVPSAWSSRDLACHGLDQRKMAVLYQGIDSDRFSPEFRSEDWRRRLAGVEGNKDGAGKRAGDSTPEKEIAPDKKILLFVGRMSAEKDLRFLADSYLELASKREDVRLAMVGDGPMRAELEELLGDSAIFTGWLKGRELAAAFASADIFVFPSSVETAGQVIIEAQASGLPAVVCSGGGASENIESDTTGLIARSRSVSDFNRCIETLLDDEGMRRSMSHAARSLAAGRSWESIFASQFETYADLVTWWRLDTDNRSTGGVETSALPAGSLFEAFAKMERERLARDSEDTGPIPLRPSR